MSSNTLTAFSSPLIELDERSNSGLRVTLSWQPVGNRLVVDVHDAEQPALSILGIPPEDATFAFQHPFAYQRVGVEVCEYEPLPRATEDSDVLDTVGDEPIPA